MKLKFKHQAYQIDENDRISRLYIDAVKSGSLAPLTDKLKNDDSQIFQLIDSVQNDARLPDIGNDRDTKHNPLNDLR